MTLTTGRLENTVEPLLTVAQGTESRSVNRKRRLIQFDIFYNIQASDLSIFQGN
jgi:hypothetical protein